MLYLIHDFNNPLFKWQFSYTRSNGLNHNKYLKTFAYIRFVQNFLAPCGDKDWMNELLLFDCSCRLSIKKIYLNISAKTCVELRIQHRGVHILLCIDSIKDISGRDLPRPKSFTNIVNFYILSICLPGNKKACFHNFMLTTHHISRVLNTEQWVNQDAKVRVVNLTILKSPIYWPNGK